MRGKIINFVNRKIEKSDFYKNEKINRIDDIDVNKILVSKKEPYGNKNSFKYFIGYNDNEIIIMSNNDNRLAILENSMKMQQCLLE